MIIVLLLLLGLCLGSFVNALVWRLYEQGRSKKKRQDKALSITKGRSMCPHCHHELAAKDLIPVLSWLELRGKCRYCHKPISWQYPLVELLTAALFIASYIWWPMELDAKGITNFAIWLIVLVGFMALIVYDLRWLLLPNRIVYPLIVLVALAAVLNATIFDGGTAYVRDTVLALGVAGGFFYALFELSRGKWIGGGDVKLGFLIGFLVSGPFQAFSVLFLASLLGTVVIAPGMALKKLTPKSHVPFGPFLIVATIIVKLFGAAMIAWYRKTLMLY
jgi:leader peptidase (prepilin peptidase)/N-methyltransferase